MATTAERRTPEAQDFSLVLGGPLFQFLRRAHLSDDALLHARRRIVVITLFCWLPLLVLSAIGGQLVGGAAAVPFLLDIEVHARFLIAVPLLVGAEMIVHQRMRGVVELFTGRGLIPEGAMTQFQEAVRSALRLRNSTLAEALLLAFVYLVGILVVWRRFTALDAETWYVISSSEGLRHSLAGVWFGYVSLPLFQFLLLRWYFRFFIWARFLWKVSRIQLSLIPTHPDGSGGLGFLFVLVHAFKPVLIAHGVLLSGYLANRIFYLDATLLDFKIEIGAMIVLLLGMVVGPLLVFAAQLSRAKRVGQNEYGTLAQRYVREFDTKWLRSGAGAGNPLLGATDIQALADMQKGFEVACSMKVVPVTRQMLLWLAVAVIAPVAPLLLTMMPMEELVKKLAAVLF
jgi:hypothetical protein